jgi:hypothetical protein
MELSFCRVAFLVFGGFELLCHDELHSGVYESPEELSDVSVRWTWHLSMHEVKRRSSRQRGVVPTVKAKGPSV